MKQILIALHTLMALAGPALAQKHPSAVPEYELKAAFVFNFALFVQWPATAFSSENEPLVIGVLGDNPFGRHLDDIVADKHLQNRPVIVERYKRLEDLRHCHLLYVSSSEKRRLGRVMQRISKQSILTVGETPGFLEAGGIIRLVSRGNKVRFEINLQGSKNVGLKISSRLLRLAENLKSAYANGKN